MRSGCAVFDRVVSSTFSAQEAAQARQEARQRQQADKRTRHAAPAVPPAAPVDSSPPELAAVHDFGMSSEQAQSEIDYLLKAGHIDEATAAQMRAAHGLAEPNTSGADGRLDDAASSPADFDFGPDFGYDAGDTQALVEFQREAGQMLHAAEMPRDLASALLKEMGGFSKVWNGMDAASQAVHMRQTESQLRALWKGDYETKRQLAGNLIRELDAKYDGAASRLIDLNGLSPMAANLIATHAERLAAKRKLPKSS
jgi:hypothetical protein